MEKFSIDMEPVLSIKIYTDVDSIIKKLKDKPESLTKTIPAKVLYEGQASDIEEQSDYITISSFGEKSINIDRENNIAILLSPSDQFFFPDLVYLAIGMFANRLQERGYYFMQSSVVKYDDHNSIMLIGDPNAGKTTMAFNLMKNNGFKLISNDNVLVSVEDGKLKTHCGTKAVQMRYGGIKLYFPEILPYVSIPEKDKDRNEWDIKVHIDNYLKENGYQYADDSTITDIFNITTYKTGDTFIRSREKIDEILLMYEHLTKQIRSNRYAIMGYNFPLPSFENERYLQERYDLSRLICENTNIYDARGTVDELSNRFVKRL